MGPYPRLYSFSGTDIEYIYRLEKALQALQFHHRNCVFQLLPPTATDSHLAPKRRHDGTVLDSLRSTSPCLSLSTPGTSSSLTPTNGASSRQCLTAPSVVAANYNPRSGSKNPLKKAQIESWRKTIDALINVTPVNEEWKSPWIVNDTVTSYNCHSPSKLILGTSPRNAISGDIESGFQDESLARAANFARSIRYYGDTADLCTKIQCFQEIILASACIVLLDCGKPQKDVDSVMKIHISNVGPKHLSRLRNGAKLANGIANGLHWNGWRNRAQELLFFWGKGLSFYGVLSDNSKLSLPYLVTQLSADKYTDGPATSTAEDHLIPSLVRSIIGTHVKEQRILELLGYTNTAPIQFSGDATSLASIIDSPPIEPIGPIDLSAQSIGLDLSTSSPGPATSLNSVTGTFPETAAEFSDTYSTQNPLDEAGQRIHANQFSDTCFTQNPLDEACQPIRANRYYDLNATQNPLDEAGQPIRANQFYDLNATQNLLDEASQPIRANQFYDLNATQNPLDEAGQPIRANQFYDLNATQNPLDEACQPIHANQWYNAGFDF